MRGTLVVKGLIVAKFVVLTLTKAQPQKDCTLIAIENGGTRSRELLHISTMIQKQPHKVRQHPTKYVDCSHYGSGDIRDLRRPLDQRVI